MATCLRDAEVRRSLVVSRDVRWAYPHLVDDLGMSQAIRQRKNESRSLRLHGANVMDFAGTAEGLCRTLTKTSVFDFASSASYLADCQILSAACLLDEFGHGT